MLRRGFWWLIRVTLVVAFGFLPQIFGRYWGPMELYFVILRMQFHQWGYHEVGYTLKPYLMQKN